MFENFFKKIKTNVSFLKSKLVFLSELKSFNAIFNIIFFFFLALIMIDNNLYYYVNQSFMNIITEYVNYFNNFYLVIAVLFLISVKNLIINTFSSSQNNSNSQNNSIFLSVIYLTYIKDILLVNLSFLSAYFTYFILHTFQTSYLLNFCISKFRTLFVPISWYTVFKRHSIFGYYRIARQNWVELKSEEVNFLKY